MRLRTFTAPSIPAAMEMVREALGENAIILSTGKHNGVSVSITAAIDAADEMEEQQQIAVGENAAPVTRPNFNQPSPTHDLRFEIQTILRFHNLPEMFVSRMVQKVSETDLTAAVALHKISGARDARHLHLLAMEKLMAAFFAFEPLAFDNPNLRIMLMGAPGAGKTLTIAKLAARLAMDKKPLTVITTDNKRAGGIEQLKAFTDILGLELQIAPSRTELSKLIADAKSRILVDTAGCNPYEQEELKELEALATVGGIEPILVLPAGGDSMEAVDAIETFSAIPIKRVLVTRADTARRFGSILASAATHGLAFANASHSASIIDPLHPADATLLAELLLRYQA
jgi:flagellar biosynthesis protein FlhF